MRNKKSDTVPRQEQELWVLSRTRKGRHRLYILWINRMGKHPRKNSKKQEGLIIQKTEKIFYIVATAKAGVKKDK